MWAKLPVLGKLVSKQLVSICVEHQIIENGFKLLLGRMYWRWKGKCHDCKSLKVAELVVWSHSLQGFTHSITSLRCGMIPQTVRILPKSRVWVRLPLESSPNSSIYFCFCCCIITDSIWYVSNWQGCIRMKEVNTGQGWKWVEMEILRESSTWRESKEGPGPGAPGTRFLS